MFSDLHPTSPATKPELIARGRLKEARETFAERGWKRLPQTERGQAILIWGADHAWLASSGNPKRSVERWCKRWAPWLTDAELRAIVSDTVISNKRWSADQSAIVLEISLAERTNRNLRHIGASDDPNYDARRDIRKAKAAERSRKYRARHSTGAKPGRPPLNLSPDEVRKRKNDQAAKRMRQYRALRQTPSRHLKEIDRVTQLSVTHAGDAVVASLLAAPSGRLISLDAPASPQPPHRKASSFNAVTNGAEPMPAGARLREAHFERNALLRLERFDTAALRWLISADSALEAARRELEQRQHHHHTRGEKPR
ncbi:hypothetical protein JQ595_37375 [Bradyrhizobium japonicum]|uniref:hypothetical protein n=1 Tax=Bradyrhizobium japonicum TaxID=375 RepID=UPI001BA8BFCE|nr:hypothetical protein [Bradyrhizobium japonicum]MBR0734434.1 hypothetical protein [Bradyrhizobium japonicum]